MNIPTIQSELEDGILELVQSGHKIGEISPIITKQGVGKTLQQMTADIDKNDLSYQTGEYSTLHELEADSVAQQLNHRAQMMRLKAQEFDALADVIRKSSANIRNEINSFANKYEEVLNILDEHSHIKPTVIRGE